MTPEDATTSYRSMLNEVGEDILIRRAGAPDVTVRARVMGYQPNELIGPITQGDVRVIAMAEELNCRLPLTTNDAVVVRGRELAIKAVDDNTRRINGVLIALEIQAGG